MKSVRARLFAGTCGLIVSFVFLTWFLNANFLSKYYYYTKRNDLGSRFEEINKKYKGDINSVSLLFQEYEQTAGLRVFMFDRSFKEKYNNSQGPMENRGLKRRGMDVEHQPFLQSLRIMIIGGLVPLDRGKYLFREIPDENFGHGEITLVGRLSADDYLVLQTPVTAINESARTANRFSLFTGIVILVIGSVFAYTFSKRFTRPILMIRDIAQRMSRLDFTYKYDVNTKDEIGELGNSINLLSYHLEKSIMELQEANEKLKDDIMQKQRIDDMRKEFVANVSHELKTPIALVQGYSEGLKYNVNEDEESKNYYCDVIIDEAQRMDRLVRQLLNLSKLESGGEKPERTDFSIGELVDGVIRKSAILLHDKDLSVTVVGDRALLVNADSYMIEQVLTNFLTNAIRHVDTEKRIEISVTRIGDKVRVSIFNSGSPIPENLQELIWTSFYRADKARSRETGNTGLGLSIAKAIVNAHGSECGLENTDNGVVFWFDLSLAEEVI